MLFNYGGPTMTGEGKKIAREKFTASKVAKDWQITADVVVSHNKGIQTLFGGACNDVFVGLTDNMWTIGKAVSVPAKARPCVPRRTSNEAPPA